MRINKGTRAKKAKSTGAKKAPRTARVFGTRAVVAAVVCFIGAAIIIGASASSPRPTEAARLDAPSDYAPVAAKKAPGSRLAAAERDIAGTSGSESMDPVPAVEQPDAIPPSAPPVTITGCLEREDDSFMLKNPSGAGAPKARSWKSGFLKKNSASVVLVDPPKKLRLPDHVGERVSLTGVLVDREMQVRAVHRAAGSCN
jgi:hypothetical protein